MSILKTTARKRREISCSWCHRSVHSPRAAGIRVEAVLYLFIFPTPSTEATKPQIHPQGL